MPNHDNHGRRGRSLRSARLAAGLALPVLAVGLAFTLAFAGAGRSPLAFGLLAALVLAAAVHFVLDRRHERIVAAEVASLKRAEREARAASLAKDEALANVSHELRTGLGGVIGTTDLLLEADLGPEIRDQVEILDTAGESLLALVDDLLDFSRIEAGRLAIKTADFGLRELVGGVLQLFRGEADGKGVTLSSEVSEELPDDLHGDPARLRQVLTNLVGNAVKYTAEGEVAVRVEPHPGDGSDLEVRFVVRDTGIGISPKDHSRLFKPFNRADSTAALRLDGIGLGLAICRRLVEMMGGGIAFESTRRVGSIFWFHVPLRRSQRPTPLPSRPRAAPRDRRSFRVLVVDDNAVNHKVAVGQLRALGCAAEAVESGGEALAALAEGTFDAVLMDCQMPGIDGWETTRRWRRLETGRPTPVIGVTAHALKGTRDKCLAAGMDDVVIKPLRGRALEAALGRWLEPGPPTAAEPEPEPEPEPRSAGAVDESAIASLAHLERAGEAGLVAATVESYLSEGSRHLATMDRAVAGRDFSSLVDSAHDLGGSSVYLGARSLAEICGELEDVGRHGDLEPVGDLLARAKAEYRQVAAELERIRRQDRSAAAEDVPVA